MLITSDQQRVDTIGAYGLSPPGVSYSPRLDALREREQAVQSEFEDQRRAFAEHGDAGVRRMAPPSQPRSLADVQPDVAVADSEADAFYDG